MLTTWALKAPSMAISWADVGGTRRIPFLEQRCPTGPSLSICPSVSESRKGLRIKDDWRGRACESSPGRHTHPYRLRVNSLSLFFLLFFLSLSRTSLLRSTHLKVVILAGVHGEKQGSTRHQARWSASPRLTKPTPCTLGTKRGKRNGAL